jgi:hypothetical protein
MKQFFITLGVLIVGVLMAPMAQNLLSVVTGAAVGVALMPSTASAQSATDASSAFTHTSVTPSNTTEYVSSTGDPYCRGIFVEVAGDISLTDRTGTTIVYTVPAATLLPFRPVRVNSTSTTATGIACWR